VNTLDPAFTEDVYQATITNQIFSGLVQWDADLNVVPDLAYSWTVSRDGLVYTFNLGQNSRFHHGRPVTTMDFIYTFTRLFRPREVPPGIIQDYLIVVEGVEDFIEGRADHISGLQAPDDHTLVIRLVHPYASFLSVLCMDQARVVPRDVVEREGSEAFGRNPVGSGPFRFANWTPGERIVLVRNDDYAGHRAFLDSVVVVHDTVDRAREGFMAGLLDVFELREIEVLALRRQHAFRTVRRLDLSMEFLGFNTRRGPFRDPRLREAVARAISREGLEAVTGDGFRRPAGILPPGMTGYSPEPKIYAEDLPRARALLAEAGYGRRTPLRFQIVSATRGARTAARDSVIVASLARVGIEASIRNVGWHELNAILDARSADAFQISWIADLPDPDSFLYTLVHSEGVFNLFEYANGEVDSLLDGGRSETDVELRLNRYREAERLVLADAPFVPIFNSLTVLAFQRFVRGVEMSPFGICSIPMEKIWFEPHSGEVAHAGL
jgi:peptide/nickel transport system substrate-binding protein/oligopeptide transport system substrate-binding protein